MRLFLVAYAGGVLTMPARASCRCCRMFEIEFLDPGVQAFAFTFG